MKRQATVTFKKLIQNKQSMSKEGEFMISELYYTFELDGVKHELKSIIKQPAGEQGDFEKNPLEVERPLNYKGDFNYMAFRDEAETYFRAQIGSHGSGIRISDSSAGSIIMWDNTFENTKVVSFEVLEHNE